MKKKRTRGDGTKGEIKKEHNKEKNDFENGSVGRGKGRARE